MTTPVKVKANFLVLAEPESGQSFDVVVGSLIVVVLEENPSTGYHWVYQSAHTPPIPIRELRNEFVQGSPRPGAPGTRIVLFEAATPGGVPLEFGLYPPGTKDPVEKLVFDINVQQ